MVVGQIPPPSPPSQLLLFDAAAALQQGTFMTLITKNDMLYSGMMDDESPNIIAFYLATIRELAGSDLQMEAAYRLHSGQQATLRPSMETDSPMEAHFGQKDRINEFRTYYARRLVNPGAPLRDNLVAELFQGGSRPLWMGLFACYGLPLVHLGDSLEVKAATYAKQALALAASNLDNDLCDLFASIVTESRRRSALFGSNGDHNCRPLRKWTRDPLSILHDLTRDGRLSGLSLVLPGYTNHAVAGRPWSSQNIVSQVVLESVWRWDLAETIDPLDALEELGRVTTVALACGTHKTHRPPEFDFFLCFLPTLVHALRVFLAAVRQQYPAVSEIALVLVRCLWAQIVLVYILQLRPKIASIPKRIEPQQPPPDDENFLFRAFYNDTVLSEPQHQDAFYLRALRSFAMLAASEQDPEWTARINDAAVKLQVNWHRWLGLAPGEATTLDIRL
ncbi:hypothetical protein Sste5346_007815 [Sporothrix stenoceras]|uniref:Transcription factor domain-containing protein n=1 Tax=Sporothrix stenoceras TaxID=5173 RepID=A0ABR3YSX0_9PEZI